MRVVVITSCTGEKAVTHEQALTLADFQRGEEWVRAKEAALHDVMMPAESLYTGQQHVRLMRGIEEARQSEALEVDLHILSAGYGLVPADRSLAPYECTFAGMKAKELRTWADQLDVPNTIQDVLANPFDLAILLLGDAYLKAAALHENTVLGGPTLAFCGKRMAQRLPTLDQLYPVPLSNADAKRFSCGLVGLKGELVGRMLNQLSQQSLSLADLLNTHDLKNLLESKETPSTPTTSLSPGIESPDNVSADTDYVIHVPESWWTKRQQKRLHYFIPEWDDLVDPDYDFETDTHAGGTGDWSNEVYAHQLYETPNYDGILISKVVAEKSKKKKRRINAMGVHRYLRVPCNFPIMGDCGAFGYVKEDVPPYTTEEILDYYTRLGFDFGVSIDHLIVKATEDQKEFRYGLTIENAEAFIKEHTAQGLPWEPMGAVQGWDLPSYAECARQLAAMGYKYIAVGGLARSSTKEVGRIAETVRSAIPDDVKVHLFGIARLQAMDQFASVGITSVDSASALRRAWLGSNDNYWSLPGPQYAAIRIPEAGKSFRAKRMVEEGRASADEVVRLEQACLKAVRGYARRQASLEDALDALDDFDHLITPDRDSMRNAYRATLEDRPWEHCPCAICQQDGVEVIIFRGNNRNRRRGFHNTWVFYHFFERVLDGETVTTVKAHKRSQDQLTLF